MSTDGQARSERVRKNEETFANANEQIRDRLVFINPAFFELHKSLGPWKKKLDLEPIYGLRFLSNESSVASEYAGKSILGYVGSLLQIQEAMQQLAKKEKVTLHEIDDIQIERLDEGGAAHGRRARRLGGGLYGEPAARRQRAVHDRDGHQDAVRRAGINSCSRNRTFSTSMH